MKKNKLVTFIFQAGRAERLDNSKEDFAKDMFYTYFNFKEDYKVDLIEFGGFKDNKFNWMLFYIEKKIIRRFFKIPLWATFLTNKKNFRKIADSDHIILSSQRIASSVLPMALLLKLLNKKTKITFFVLGMYSSSPRYKLLKFIQELFYRLLIIFSDNLIFIGQGEYEFAIKKNKFLSKKFHYIPFGIDSKFWNFENNNTISKREGVVFVGNDSNRDFELAKKIAKNLSHLSFTFVTSGLKDSELPDNVRLFEGSWAEPAISDKELRAIYSSSRLTIIPLMESMQPSGQSVALQSMAAGTPVLITNTEGLWDRKNINHDENIFLIDNNSIELWIEKVEKLYSDIDKLNDLSKNSIKTIEECFDVNKFYQEIKKLIKI